MKTSENFPNSDGVAMYVWSDFDPPPVARSEFQRRPGLREIKIGDLAATESDLAKQRTAALSKGDHHTDHDKGVR